MDSNKETKEPRFSVVQDPGWKVVHVDGAYGVLNSVGGQLTLYQDLMKAGVDEHGSMVMKAIERVLIADIRMSPEVFRATAYWMMEQVQNYEKEMLEIFQQEEIRDE